MGSAAAGRVMDEDEDETAEIDFEDDGEEEANAHEGGAAEPVRSRVSKHSQLLLARKNARSKYSVKSSEIYNKGPVTSGTARMIIQNAQAAKD